MTSQHYPGATAAGATSADDSMAAVRADLALLRADVRRLMDTVEHLGGGSDIGSAAVRTINQAVTTVEEAAERAYDRLSRQTQTYTSSFERTVSEHPYGATAMAVAAGMFLSRLFERPNR